VWGLREKMVERIWEIRKMAMGISRELRLKIMRE
jgi:hypothetical protein